MSGGDMDAAESNDAVKIKIRSKHGLKYVHANLNSTVLNFKTILAQNCQVPAPQQRLIHKARLLKDDQTLRSYGLEGDDAVYLFQGSVPDAPGADTTTNTDEDPDISLEMTIREGLDLLGEFSVSKARDAGRRHMNLGALDIYIGNTMPFGSLFPELGLGSRPDLTTSELDDLKQDAEISEMTSKMLSDPRYLNKKLAFNPELQEVLHFKPWIRDAMQNPAFIQRLAAPQIVLTLTTSTLIPCQQLLIYHRGLEYQVAREEGLTDEEKGFETAAWSLEKLMNVFGEVATHVGISSAATTSRPQGLPEEQFATQLSQLQEMGFSNTQENIQALIATAGNVEAAVGRLLGI